MNATYHDDVIVVLCYYCVSGTVTMEVRAALQSGPIRWDIAITVTARVARDFVAT